MKLKCCDPKSIKEMNLILLKGKLSHAEKKRNEYIEALKWTQNRVPLQKGVKTYEKRIKAIEEQIETEQKKYNNN